MKKTIEQLIAEGKRKRAERLRRRELWPSRDTLTGRVMRPELLVNADITSLTQNWISKYFEEPLITTSMAQRHEDITGNAPTVIRITNNDLRAAAQWMREEEQLSDDDAD